MTAIIDRRRAEMPLYRTVLDLFTAGRDLLRRAGEHDAALDDSLFCLEQALRFRVDNVATWMYENIFPKPGQEATPAAEVLAKLPNLAPIADYVWFEYESKPERAHDPHAVVVGRDQGCLVRVVADRAQPARLLPETVRTLDRIEAALGRPVRWLLETEDYLFSLDPAHPGVWLPDWIVTMMVAEDGTLLRYASRPNPLVPQGDATFRDNIAEETLVALSALSFLHARNVRTTEQVPPRAARRAAARKGLPVLTFKTLDIDLPARAVREAQMRGGGSALEALHRVRGSFAFYTHEKPLFGQPGKGHEGLIYRPMHTRGSAAAGAVVKEYRTRGALPKETDPGLG